jgi:CRP/FNR family transcriptional regulator
MLDIVTLTRQCPIQAGLSAADADAVAHQAMPINTPAGTRVFDIGNACQSLPLVLSGSIRVFKQAESGREISLYRVNPGELCIVTVSCLLGGDAYPATGIAETDIAPLTLPRPLFMRLIDNHPPFRQAVFHLFAERMSGLMQLVEEVAFRKLDQRLAALLAARAPLVGSSHQQLADELGSVREIVSRLLKQFEERGWIRLGREKVEVLAPNALDEFASAYR